MEVLEIQNSEKEPLSTNSTWTSSLIEGRALDIPRGGNCPLPHNWLKPKISDLGLLRGQRAFAGGEMRMRSDSCFTSPQRGSSSKDAGVNIGAWQLLHTHTHTHTGVNMGAFQLLNTHTHTHTHTAVGIQLFPALCSHSVGNQTGEHLHAISIRESQTLEGETSKRHRCHKREKSECWWRGSDGSAPF